MALFPLFHYLIFAIFNFYLISQFWALRLSSGGYFKFNVNRKMLKCQNYKNPSWTFLTECYIQRRSILRPILHPFGSKILQNYFNNPKASTKWEMDTVEGWRSAFLETRGQALFVRGGVSLLAKLEGKPHLSGSSNVTRTWRRKSYKKKRKKKQAFRCFHANARFAPLFHTRLVPLRSSLFERSPIGAARILLIFRAETSGRICGLRVIFWRVSNSVAFDWHLHRGISFLCRDGVLRFEGWKDFINFLRRQMFRELLCI